MNENENLVPKRRFKEFTNTGTWEQRKLIDVAEMFDNLRIPVTASDRVEGNTAYYGANGIQDYVDGFTHDGEFVLIAEDGANDLINYPVNYVKGKIWVNNHAHVVSGKKSELDNLFLTARIKSMNISHWLVGGGRAKLNGDVLKKIPLTLPIYEEQKKIGAFFKQLDDAIALHQRKLDKTKSLKSAYLLEMFPADGERKPKRRFAGFTDDWEQSKLDEVVKSHNAGVYIAKEKYGAGTNVIGVGNIYGGDSVDGEIYRLGPVADEKYILDENDLIYGESSLVPEGIARTMYVTKNGAGTAFAWHTRRVKINTDICNAHVLTLELNYNKEIRNYLISVSTQTALTGITTDGYFNTVIYYPSLAEQDKISSFFTKLDNLINVHQRKLEKLQNIKKAYLNEMFV